MIFSPVANFAQQALVTDKPLLKPCMKVQLTTQYLTTKLVVELNMLLLTVKAKLMQVFQLFA